VTPALLVALSACGPDGGDTPAAPAELPPSALLSRVSIDLRGVRPSIEELEEVDADPTRLDAAIDEYLADPRFEERVVDLFSEIWLTRTETFPVNFEAFDLTGFDYADVIRSVGEQPLRAVGHVAANDLPITDLVTADWTVADPILARMWPVDYPSGQDGWQRVPWTDGRPAAGVLVSNSVYWRYPSTDSNANRKRANQVSRILLCHDYLTRPIDFDRNVNLLDEGALQDALRNNEGCVNCHATLDPFAAYFFGFWTYEFTANEVSNYHPSRERLWESALGTAPAFYGEPGDGLEDLGWQIAADERFPQCLTEQVTELLLRRPADLLDADRLTAHREALVSEMTLRPLFRSVVTSPEYRAAESDPAGRAVPAKMMTPDLLATTVQDLTGFAWVGTSGQDLLRTDLAGFQTLAGGADGAHRHRLEPRTQHHRAPGAGAPRRGRVGLRRRARPRGPRRRPAVPRREVHGDPRHGARRDGDPDPFAPPPRARARRGPPTGPKWPRTSSSGASCTPSTRTCPARGPGS
jgi:hypothetical protein